jgi:hypothetical protein
MYDVSLGDIVETDKDYLVRRTITPSERYVFRVWLESSQPHVEAVIPQLAALGGLMERLSQNLLAVDAADERHAQLIARFLHDKEQQQELIYETGRR